MGVGVIEEAKLIICDLYVQFRWYVVKSGVFKGFLKTGEKAEILISEVNRGVLWL